MALAKAMKHACNRKGRCHLIRVPVILTSSVLAGMIGVHIIFPANWLHHL